MIRDGIMAAFTLGVTAATAYAGLTWHAAFGGVVAGLWVNDFVRGMIRRNGRTK